MLKKNVLQIQTALLLALGIAGAILTSCQSPPKTSLGEEQSLVLKNSNQEELRRLKKMVEDPESVLLDTRGPQEYFLSHVPGSRMANHREFMSLKSEQDYFVQPQHESIVRRWALWGINPQTTVVILGKGIQGQGEQAWWAWFLYGLGVKDIHLANIEDFRQRVSSSDEDMARKKNKSFWKANGILNEMTAVELKKIIKTNNVYKKASFLYVGDKSTELSPKIKKLNWKKFFNANTTVRAEVVLDLSSLGLSKDSAVVVVTDNGVSSGAVAYALESLGYAHIKNYPGSIQLIKTLF